MNAGDPFKGREAFEGGRVLKNLGRAHEFSPPQDFRASLRLFRFFLDLHLRANNDGPTRCRDLFGQKIFFSAFGKFAFKEMMGEKSRRSDSIILLFLFYRKYKCIFLLLLLYRVTFLHFYSSRFPLIVFFFFLRLLRGTNCKLDFAIYNYTSYGDNVGYVDGIFSPWLKKVFTRSDMDKEQIYRFLRIGALITLSRASFDLNGERNDSPNDFHSK